MAKFNTNQNRQFYVATAVKEVDASHKVVETLTDLGDTSVQITPKKDFIYFNQKGQGGIVRSDLIPVKSVTYAKLNTADKMKRALKARKITLDANVNGGEPLVGQDYIMTIVIQNAFGGGLDDIYVKASANVHATANMTAAKFYRAMYDSLKMNYSREQNKWFEFGLIAGNSEVTDIPAKAADDANEYTGVLIKELELSWNLGKMTDDGIDFYVQTAPVASQDDADLVWATMGDDMKVGEDYTEEYNTKVGNGKKIADMEYFFHGERGDKYRDSIGDMAIPTKYMVVDPSAEYDTLDIHYSYQGSCEDIQKSEKDITIVSSTEASTGVTKLAQFLADNGITVFDQNGEVIEPSSNSSSSNSGSEGGNSGSNAGGNSETTNP